MISIVHLLTNRSGPFNSAALPARSSAWEVVQCSDATEELRKYLQLSRQDTDYYVLFFLRLLRALPDLADLIDPQGTMDDCRLDAAPVEIPTCTNGRLAAHGGQPAHIAMVTRVWPPVESLSVSLSGDTQVSMAYEGVEQLVPCRRAGPNVYVDWPVSVHGRIEWTNVDAPFTLNFRPRIDCKVLRSYLSRHDQAQTLLQRCGLHLAFSETMDAARAVALAAVALGRATRNGW